MIYCFLAGGFEEMEALCPIDILRRGECEIAVAGVGGKIITGSHGVSVCADIADSEIVLDSRLEMIILPGGMPGTLNLEKNANVQRAVDFCAENNRFIGAICAAPSILGHKGLLKDKEAICFPGFEGQLNCKRLSEEYVCRDGSIITAKGAGVAQEFGLKLLECVKGSAVSEKIKASLQCR
ncbi:MAG TPA: DJ-1 family protein [Ruminococcaceae bacterium]|nr:DJ-1 family protein [Oscillospiraceae bacterium]